MKMSSAVYVVLPSLTLNDGGLKGGKPAGMSSGTENGYRSNTSKMATAPAAATTMRALRTAPIQQYSYTAIRQYGNTALLQYNYSNSAIMSTDFNEDLLKVTLQEE